jgi:hypothetical protein
MEKLFLILFIFSIAKFTYSQGSFTQTTTVDFNNNVNYNISTSNDEVKLVCDVGTGSQGNLYVPTGTAIVIDSVRTNIIGNNNAGQCYINVVSTSGFKINDEVLIITSQHTNVSKAGQYEFRRIQKVTTSILYLYDPLKNTYDSNFVYQVVRVPNYYNVTVEGMLTCSPWDGQTGGVLVFRAAGLVKVTGAGRISADTMGYRYGTQIPHSIGTDGEGIISNGGQGGCAPYIRCIYPRYGGSGYGGGHGKIGFVLPSDCCSAPWRGGFVVGDSLLSKMFFGGAGGGGGCGSVDPHGCEDMGARGGRGGGIVYLACDSLSIENYISVNPQGASQPGGPYGGRGGDGAGGTVYIISQKNIYIGNNLILANSPQPDFGEGRIRIDAPNVTGTSNPNYKYSAINYAFLGSSVSPVISKLSSNGWLTLTFNADTSLLGTSVRFDVLNTRDSTLITNIQSGSNLNDLGLSQSIDSIKLKAKLMNIVADKTPKLFDWSINWGNSVPSRPELISPANGSVDIPLTPLLDWNDVATSVNYKLQLSLSAGFITYIINDSSLTSSQYQISNGLLSSNVIYYWRVCAKNSLGWSVFSPVFNFTTPPIVPAAPVLISPTNGTVNQPTTIIFKWHKSIDPPPETLVKSNEYSLLNEFKGPMTVGKYWFEYSTDSTFSTVILTDSSRTDTSKTISGLQNYTTYFWRVKAKNQTGWGNFSPNWNFTTIAPMPTAPVLISPPDSSIDISLTTVIDWNDVPYASYYRLLISGDSLFGTRALDTSGITMSNVIIPSGKLATHKKYYWKVNATNAAGTGPWSSVRIFTTVPNAPNVPILLLPSNGAANQPTTVTFKWNRAAETLVAGLNKNYKQIRSPRNLNQSSKIKKSDKIDSQDAISKYWLEYSTDSIFAAKIIDSTITDTLKVLSGLDNLTKYYWRVKAKNQGGWGNFSSIWSFTTIIPVPAVPVLLSPASGSLDISLTPVLDWNDVVFASSYRLQISLDSLFGTLSFDSSSLTLSSLTIPVGKLTTLKKYYWRINASNIAGTSAYSSPFNFTTIPNVPGMPVLSLPVNGAVNQQTTVSFKWYKTAETLLNPVVLNVNKSPMVNEKNNLMAINKYWFEYGTDSTLSNVIARDSSIMDTTKILSGLLNNTAYYWRVKAKNQTGWGGFSVIWKFSTIVPVPSAPLLLSPIDNSIDIPLTPSLEWSLVSFASSYRIQVSSDSTFTTAEFDTTGTAFPQLVVPPGKLTGLTKYFWRINASNINGTSLWSAVWNFRTLQNLILNLKVYLEGFWTGSTLVRDTVMVYLAGASMPNTFADSSKVYLSATGTAAITFTKAPNANYYIVVQHRNHLQTWCAVPKSFVTNAPVNFDFTTGPGQAYGGNMKQVGSVWVLFGGDANQDGSIDAYDVIIFVPQYGTQGYLSADFNGDGDVTAADVIIITANFGLTKAVPTLNIIQLLPAKKKLDINDVMMKKNSDKVNKQNKK